MRALFYTLEGCCLRWTPLLATILHKTRLSCEGFAGGSPGNVLAEQLLEMRITDFDRREAAELPIY